MKGRVLGWNWDLFNLTVIYTVRHCLGVKRVSMHTVIYTRES